LQGRRRSLHRDHEWGKANGRGYSNCLSAFLVAFYV
jgi:hypothetical protein